MLIIGYLVYWVELFGLKSHSGYASPLAAIIFLLISFCPVLIFLKSIPQKLVKLYQFVRNLTFFKKIFFSLFFFLTTFILIIALKASLLPPHLPQEFDTINYHITIPRQHLLRDSFRFLEWSSADLFLLPIDYALTPFWLVTKLPNKMPQFIFFLGLIFVVFRLAGQYTNNHFLSQCLAVVAVVASHNVVIQAGTAMLDIVMCYLFLSAMNNFLEGNPILSSIEFTFYFWSKSFIPLQVIIVLILLLMFFLIFRMIQGRLRIPLRQWITPEIKKNAAKALLFFFIFSFFIGGPFVIKSMIYGGTPLYPFAPGVMKTELINHDTVSWKSLNESARLNMGIRDQYGLGRSIIPFLKHFWLISVPERGVNNSFDYPVGLVYLLCLGPFVSLLIQTFRTKIFSINIFIVVAFWITWWLGSHQSRFLFIPIVLMILIVVSERKFQTTFFYCGVMLALIFSSLSIARAYWNDFGKSSYEVLRAKDKKLLEMSKFVDHNQQVVLEFHDVAFADFAVKVKAKSSVFVIEE